MSIHKYPILYLVFRCHGKCLRVQLIIITKRNEFIGEGLNI